MILIADSGSTKTDWCVPGNDRQVRRLQTSGLNPFFETGQEICRKLEKELLPSLAEEEIEAVYFYGAGCVPEKCSLVRDALASVFSFENVEVGSDLLGAARSLCGRDPGIACILGTGSNSCFYDGRIIAANVSPLGFILGDEGSGAVLGRAFVGDCLKNLLPPEIREAFLEEYGLTPSMILDRVYREPFPNRFLAGLTPFMARHLDVPGIRTIVLKSFTAFFTRNVKQYDYKRYPVHVTGSVGFYFREVLEEAARETGVCLGNIQQRPMEGLLRYHALKKQDNN